MLLRYQYSSLSEATLFLLDLDDIIPDYVIHFSSHLQQMPNMLNIAFCLLQGSLQYLNRSDDSVIF